MLEKAGFQSNLEVNTGKSFVGPAHCWLLESQELLPFPLQREPCVAFSIHLLFSQGPCSQKDWKLTFPIPEESRQDAWS